MASFEDQLQQACEAIVAHAKGPGVLLGNNCAAAAKPILTWVDWYQRSRPHSHALELLSGTEASVLEAVSYVSMGLARAALTAIRAQVDLVLGFTYFREHPAEWRLVNWTGDGFKLRSDIFKYQKEIDPGRGGFNDRLGIMDQQNKPTLETCYRILSAHLHGQSANTLPKTGTIVELVATLDTLRDVVRLQEQTAIALSGYLLTLHAHEWNELPPDLVAWGKQLLTRDQQKAFFVGPD